jgi:hypothetical protein
MITPIDAVLIGEKPLERSRRGAFLPDDSVTRARDGLPDARSFYYSNCDKLSSIDEVIWLKWCNLLDSQTTLVPGWTEAEPDDVRRLYAAADYENGEVSYAITVLSHAYSFLESLGVSVSDAWAGSDPPESGDAKPIDESTWRALKTPVRGNHYLDVRDNALKILTTQLALSAHEIARLQARQVSIQSTKPPLVFVDLVSPDGHGRSLVAQGTAATQLIAWLCYPKSRRWRRGPDYFLNSDASGSTAREVHALVRRMVRRIRVWQGLPLQPFVWSSIRFRRLNELLTIGLADESIAYRLNLTPTAVARARSHLAA